MTEPTPRMTATQFRARWEEAEMDLTLLMERTIETQHKLHQLIGIHADLYRGVLGEEAPEPEFRPRIVREAS